MLPPYLSQDRREDARPPAVTRRQGASPGQGGGDPPAGRAPLAPRGPQPSEPPPQRSAGARRQRRSPRRHLPGSIRGAADIDPAPPPPPAAGRMRSTGPGASGPLAARPAGRGRLRPVEIAVAPGRAQHAGRAPRAGGKLPAIRRGRSWQRGNAGRGAQGLPAVTAAAGPPSRLGNAPGSRRRAGPGRPIRGEGRRQGPASSVSLKTAQTEGPVGGQRPCAAGPGPWGL